MFKKKKKIDKNLEFYINIINEISTLRVQNEYLFSRIGDLEARLEKLEPKEEMKIDVFAGEGVL